MNDYAATNYTYKCNKVLPWISDGMGDVVRLTLWQLGTRYILDVITPDGMVWERTSTSYREANTRYEQIDRLSKRILRANGFREMRKAVRS